MKLIGSTVCSHDKFEVVVHPESVIHSAVEFSDGAVMAQLGTPDMRLPIQYAFSYPDRLPLQSERLDLFSLGSLHFERPDEERFPCLRLSYEAIEQGGNMPCVLNAAGEVANLAFRQEHIRFMAIPHIIEDAMQQAPSSLSLRSTIYSKQTRWCATSLRL